ncbi:hypothetical protein RB195_026301 [Necator americanus]|uniref:C2H2-type domain-containing protein n=1 Tax=Necator americanus TaxID=51031 RepID=A0ABR1EWJ4_NECAM
MECPVCGATKSRMERHLVNVHGFSQDRIAEFMAQKKSRKIAASGKPIHNYICHCELAEHAHQEYVENANQFVVETFIFQNLRDNQSWKLASEEAGVISRFIAKMRTTKDTNVTFFGTRENEEVTEEVDGVTVENCFNHLGHEARPSQLRLKNSAEQYIVFLLRDGLTVLQVYKKT